MKVAVVGAGGFVGQNVTKKLATMADVRQISLLDQVDFPHPDAKNIVKTVGDLADPAVRSTALDGADKVIILAAILGGAAETDYALARRINIEGMLDIFEHLHAQNPATRTVFASTIAVFAKPLPDPVTDTTPCGPTMVYGAQKLMMEVALSNFSARGWLDGVSVRPSGVMARDGADAALKTAFMSRLFWCVQRGENITLPVAPDSQAWFTSVSNVADNFIHAAMLPEVGSDRAFTLPALVLTFEELVAALKRQFPDSPSQVSYDPDPEIVDLFGAYPQLETKIADRLGFTRDANADALVKNAMI